MSRFYAEVSPDNRNTVSRRGHKYISAHIRGWNIGVAVTVKINEKGKDEVLVYKTSGSTKSKSDELITKYTG